VHNGAGYQHLHLQINFGRFADDRLARVRVIDHYKQAIYISDAGSSGHNLVCISLNRGD
jgi:hypothetical protein